MTLKYPWKGFSPEQDTVEKWTHQWQFQLLAQVYQAGCLCISAFEKCVSHISIKWHFSPKLNETVYNKKIYTIKLPSSCFGEVKNCVSFLTGNSIQKWMWVEKGVPGVSTCTVWQSEYPWFLICPFLMWSRSQHQRCVRYGSQLQFIR